LTSPENTRFINAQHFATTMQKLLLIINQLSKQQNCCIENHNKTQHFFFPSWEGLGAAPASGWWVICFILCNKSQQFERLA